MYICMCINYAYLGQDIATGEHLHVTDLSRLATPL